MDDEPREWVRLEDGLSFEECRLRGIILDELIEETVHERERVFARRDEDRAGWRA